MLCIYEAEELFERINKSPNLKLDGVLIHNSVSKNYGRTYVRTYLEICGNFSLFSEETYISYPIVSYTYKQTSSQTNNICDETFEEQKRDAITLKNKILSLFPDISISIMLSPYWNDYSDVVLTGENLYVDCNVDQLDGEFQRRHKDSVKFFQDANEHYYIFKKAVKEMYKKLKSWC